MTWKILRPLDGDSLPDATVSLHWAYEELHGARFIADVGDGDDQFIAFQLVDGRTAKLLSIDLEEHSDGNDTIVWVGN
jgi:hypothetical protein